MPFEIRVKGMDEVRANLAVLRERLPIDFGYAMREESMAIMEESQQQCPVDDANMHTDGSPHLVDTADVQGPYFEGRDISVIMSYGNPDDPTDKYAVIQHENLEYHHTRPGTKAKYLEDPAMERVPFIASNLAKGIQIEANAGYYSAQSIAALKDALGQQGRWNRLSGLNSRSGRGTSMPTGRFA
jgi:hypothetical protein